MKLGPDWLRERRFWRSNADRDVNDELSFHLAMRAQLLQQQGLDPQTARDAALERFGDLDDVRARCLDISHERERRMKRRELWTTLSQHVRYALRRLRAAPGFATAVLLILALGIGATTAVFGVVDGILLRPLPFHEPERLVALTHTIALSGMQNIDQSDGTIMLYQRHATQSFEGIGAYRERDVNLGAIASSGDPAERVLSATVTPSLFPTLGVAPVRGRALRRDDAAPGAPAVVVLSTQLWHRKFGGDPAIVGRRLVIDGAEREVVGVMPEAFRYPSATTTLWLPLAFDPAKTNPASFNFHGVARLRAGVSPATATAELDHWLPRLLEEYPAPIPPDMWERAHIRAVVTPLRDVVIGDAAHLLWMLLGAVVLLLAIACANVASLFVVRGEGAQRELAIRLALGAGSGAVVAQYLTEAALLTGGGAALGVLLAVLGIRALHASPNGADLPRLAEVAVDARVVLFAVGIAALSALVVSILPVLRARHVAPGVVLKESSRSATSGPARQRARSLLVVLQVALALVLVAGSTLMARSFAELRDVQPGFDARNVLTLRFSLPRGGNDDPVARARFYQRMIEEAEALPGVRSVTVMDWLPLSDDSNDSVVQLEDQPLPSGTVPPDHPMTYVSADYFSTLGVPVIEGRSFARADAVRPTTEALVSRSFARKYWNGASPIGKRLRPNIQGPWFTIVGVVGDVHMRSLDRPAEELVYLPLLIPDDEGSIFAPNGVSVAVRTTGGDPSALTTRVREMFRSLDPSLPIYAEQPMTALLASATARTRFVLLMLGVASVVALAIGMVGLYGVLAYGVTLRRREIGVRVALGATARDVTLMVARSGIVLAVVGVVAGLLGTMAATRVLQNLLYGVSPTDPVALAGACLVLLIVAAVASWLPARQAAVIDPMEALRRD
jgi:putative ABC transport system permease protein